MKSELVSTLGALRVFLDRLNDCKGSPPALYVDLEGDNLSRNGTLALCTILYEPEDKVYIVDVTRLKSSAFSTAGTKGHTLRSIMESQDIIKIFFDIRNDSDALYSLFGIRVGGIEDLQLMELASRTGSKRCVNGLAKCVGQDAGLTWEEKSRWQKVKDDGRKLYDPARGGSYSVFDQRPLSAVMLEYYCQDATLMPKLRDVYRRKLCDASWLKIQEETEARILLSQSVNFNGKGRHMALGPSKWMHWCPQASQSTMRTLVGVEPPRQRILPAEQPLLAEPSVQEAPTDLSKVIEDTEKLSLQSEDKRPTANVFRPGFARPDSRALFSAQDNHVLQDGGYRSYSSASDENNSVGDDFAACDKDDCGYCGRCRY